MKALVKEIEEHKIFAIIRGIQEEKMEPLFHALLKGGIKYAEITLNTKSAYKSIENMNKVFGSQMVIGAGTVLNKHMAEEAVKAGAKFLVSPNVDKGMIKTAIKHNILPLPGAMTPTEIAQAMNYGAEIVKLFPSTKLGPEYIKELRGPFDSLKLIAVGGVSAENAGEYIRAGAIGVGVGSSLIDKTCIEKEDYESIVKYAVRLREAVTA